MGEIISKITPVFILIFIGFIFKKRDFLKQQTINEIKKLVLDIALPALLFIIFIEMEIKIEALGLTIVNFLFLCFLFILCHLIKNLKGISSPILPFLTPGLSFGIMGIPLFHSVFGMEVLPRFTILNIGNELFIWFILVIGLKNYFSGEKFNLSVFKDFIRSPFIIAVLSGLIINISGLKIILSQSMIYSGLVSTLDLLGTIVTPLIFIILGYDLQLNKNYIRESVYDNLKVS